MGKYKCPCKDCLVYTCCSVMCNECILFAYKVTCELGIMTTHQKKEFKKSTPVELRESIEYLHDTNNVLRY